MTDSSTKERRKISARRFGWLPLPLLLLGALGAWFVLDPGFRWGRDAPGVAAEMPRDKFERRDVRRQGRPRSSQAGKYVAFHKAQFELRGPIDANRAMAAAANVGLDIARLKADMNDPAIETAIAKNIALAQALRINGTPGFVIGNKVLRGATDLRALQVLIGEAKASQ